MKTPFSTQALALLVAAVLPLVAPAASESPSLLLQKAIYAEEIERNLDSAIKIYEQIAAESATNRAVVAQAQYRLAVCYQKKGNKEQAIRLLNELVLQSPADPSVIKKAHEMLAELGVTPPEAVSVRRIPLAGTPGWIVAVSPDGRLAGYQPWDSTELYVQDLVMGKTHLVAKDADMTGHSPPARFSPDGQWIAYDYQEAGIHIAKTDGTEVRKLLVATRGNKKGDGSDHWNEIAGWSADGTQVIMAQWDYTRKCRVAVALDAQSGAAKEIAPVNYRPADQWSISDDGGFVARRTGEYPKTITLLDFKTGHEETVLDHDAESVIGWVSGDTRLVYSKNELHGVGIWLVAVQNGKAVDEPRLVSGDAVKNFSRDSRRAYPLGVTRDGRIFYTVERAKPAPAELWVLEGFLSTKPTPVMLGTEIPPNELIVGADRSLQYKKIGLSAKLPAGWRVIGANRMGNNASAIRLGVAGAENATLMIQYRATTPWLFASKTKRPAPDEEEAFLRERAEKSAQGSEKQSGQWMKDFKRDTAGAALWLVGGHKAVSWSGSFMRKDVPWTYLALHVYSEKSYAFITLQTPSAGLDAIRPAYESFVESFRLP